jgi:hypothetical protein
MSFYPLGQSPKALFSQRSKDRCHFLNMYQTNTYFLVNQKYILIFENIRFGRLHKSTFDRKKINKSIYLLAAEETISFVVYSTALYLMEIISKIFKHEKKSYHLHFVAFFNNHKLQ